MRLDPFYPVLPDATFIERLVPLGIKLVQLRLKLADDVEIRSQIRRARDVCDAHECRLVVNDHWRHAMEAGCEFIHLGQEDLDGADVAAIRRAGIKLGVSTHDDSELERALALKPDYVALGPVYPTMLKKMRWGPQGLARVAEWKRRVGATPLVAIGGLSVERIAGTLSAGADCCAVVTDITLSGDPEGRTQAWIAATRGAT